MKLIRKLFFGLVISGLLVFISSALLPQMVLAKNNDSSAKNVKRLARTKLLLDSVAALQQIDPDLAKRLNELVPSKAVEDKKKKTPQAKAQLYKDAAAALEQSYPDLAKGLAEMSTVKIKEKKITDTEK